MIILNDITKDYGKGAAQVRALNEVNLKISKGDMIAIMGRSGCGKSTLLNILGGLDSPSCGEYYFQDKRVNFNNPKELSHFRRDHIGFVVQSFALIEDCDVTYNVSLPLKYRGLSKKECDKKTKRVIQMVGLEEKAKALPSELSGGQKQRVAIARAIVNTPTVLLADEPTGSLDSQTASEILDILKELHKAGTSIIIVTHDKEVAAQCDHTLIMEDGRIQTL